MQSQTKEEMFTVLEHSLNTSEQNSEGRSR